MIRIRQDISWLLLWPPREPIQRWARHSTLRCTCAFCQVAPGAQAWEGGGGLLNSSSRRLYTQRIPLESTDGRSFANWLIQLTLNSSIMAPSTVPSLLTLGIVQVHTPHPPGCHLPGGVEIQAVELGSGMGGVKKLFRGATGARPVVELPFQQY